MSRARVDSDVGLLTRRLARTMAVVVVLGILAAWCLTRIVVRPLAELVDVAHRVKAGDYRAQATVRARDELGELATAFNEMIGALAEKESASQRLHQRVIQAGEEERKRVARELHDHTGQSLTSLIAMLGALETQCGEAALRERLGTLRKQVEESLTEIHDLSVALRPSVLDDAGLLPALQRHCRTFAQRLKVDVICTDDGFGDQRLPGEVELALYRVVQEALTNAVRHGRAQRIRVAVRRTPTGVLTIVRDDGRGFDAEDWLNRRFDRNQLGLAGIEERVALLGGSFCIESKPGQGTTVYADIPLKGQT